jgi:hypothetical protein
VNGNLTYTVTATPGNVGIGKIVQRTVQVPAQAIVPLKPNSETNGQYQMLTFPFEFGSVTPSSILFPNLATGTMPLVDIAYWSPTNGNYLAGNSFTPGDAYWIRNVLNVTPSPINTALYPPVPNQIQPNATPIRKTYGQGWNQIGSPYIYESNFSDIEIFDTQTLQLYTMAQATAPGVNLILPVVYSYDTSNSDPTQWQYVPQENLGFVMEPYQGYWLYVYQPNLQFIYSGVNAPGAAIVSKATKPVGPVTQLGKGAIDNWRLRLAATGASGSDNYNYIGVAPKATDSLDAYKYVKPPVMNNQLTMDIVHTDWKYGSRYMQDLRSTASTPKTWDVVVKSAKPNEKVTVSWPELNSSVPRGYKITAVDTQTNATIDLHSRSSYTVNTGATATYHLQFVATPTQNVGRIQITAFDVAQPTRAVGQTPTSVAINYAVAGDAQTYILIRDGHGRTIRQLETQTRAAGAPNAGTVVWDLHTSAGVAVTSGVYNLELDAVTSAGQRTRQTRTMTLIR